MQRPSLGGAKAALTAALLLLLGTAGVLYSGLQRVQEQTNRLEPLAERTRVRDALVGRQPKPEVRAADPSGERVPVFRPSGRNLVWVVDPGTCVSCLADLGPWRRAARQPGLTATLVLRGVGRETAREIAVDAGLSGRLLVDPDGAVLERLGVEEPPPSVALLTTSRGRIAATAARRSAKSCQWDAIERALWLVNDGKRSADRGPTAEDSRPATSD